MDATDAGRDAADRLVGLLDDVNFPIGRDRLVRHLADRELQIAPGNVIRPADFLADAPEEEFDSPVAVARRLVLAGAIREDSPQAAGGEGDLPGPGGQGTETHYESDHHHTTTDSSATTTGVRDPVRRPPT